MPPRADGAFLFGIGAVALLVGIVMPGLSGRAPNYFGLVLSACGVPCVVLGAIHFAIGARAIPYLGVPHVLRSWRARYWAPLVAAGILLFIALRWYFGA